jgi:hypothetical protein
MKIENQIYCDYCGAELKSHPFFYRLGDIVGDDIICAVCFDGYFKGHLGKDRVRKYDSKTMKKIEG